MKISAAIKCYLTYHRMNSKKNTARNYETILLRFDSTFPDRELESITSEEILSFLNQINSAANQTMKRLRYSLIKAFYNFCKNTLDETISNPCATSMLKKTFRDRRGVEWIILEKEVIDEIIFKTENHRDNPAACQFSYHTEVFRKSERYRSRAMD